MSIDTVTGHGLRIGLFDSGVGGLSLLPELLARFPDADVTYCCDNAFYPYGIRSDATIQERVRLVTQALVEQYGLHLLVVACNTAATLALDLVRASVSVPVIGVVPAIKPAAQLTRTGVIGLLATHATVSRPYTDQLIANFAPNCRVVRKGSGVLVDLAEGKLRGQKVDSRLVAQEVKELTQDPDLDVVVLGCTHFSHLREELQHVVTRPIVWIDSTIAIVRRVETIVATLREVMKPDQQASIRLVYTKESEQFSESIKTLWRELFGFSTFSVILSTSEGSQLVDLLRPPVSV